MRTLHEQEERLWMLVIAPALWAAHFLLSYATVAVWCARVVGRDGALGPARVAIAAYTLVALAGIGWTGWIGWRAHRYGGASLPHEADTAADRHRLIGVATLLLSCLGGVAVVFTALAAVFIGTCT